MEPIEIMLDDLGRQIAQKSIELAEWKARAITAEGTISKIAEAEAQEEAPELSVVPDPEKDEG